MNKPTAARRSPRSTLLLILGLAALSLVGGVVAVVVRAGGGIARVEHATTEDAQGRVAVRFTNRGTREGFLCGWVNMTCPASARRTGYVCSDQLAPARQRTVSTRLQSGGRAGCLVSFIADDVELP